MHQNLCASFFLVHCLFEKTKVIFELYVTNRVERYVDRSISWRFENRRRRNGRRKLLFSPEKMKSIFWLSSLPVTWQHQGGSGFLNPGHQMDPTSQIWDPYHAPYHASTQDLFLFLTLRFLVDLRGLGLSAQKRYSHPLFLLPSLFCTPLIMILSDFQLISKSTFVNFSLFKLMVHIFMLKLCKSLLTSFQTFFNLFS